MRKRLFAAGDRGDCCGGIKVGAAVVAAVTLLGACGSASGNGATGSAGSTTAGTGGSGSAPAHLTTVSFDGSTLGELQFDIAQNKGFLSKYGLTGTFSQLSGALSTQELLAGKIDYGFNIGTEVDTAIAGGSPLRTMATYNNKVTIDLVARPGIQSLAQLSGGTIVTPGSTSVHEVYTRKLLEGQGGNLASSVKYTHLNASSSNSEVALLLAGKVQAAVVASLNLFALPPNYPVLYNFASTSSPFVGLEQGLATTTNYASAHSAQTRNVIKALSGAAQYLATNEAGSVPYFEQIWHLNATDAQKAWADMKPTWTANPVPTDAQLTNALQVDKVVSPAKFDKVSTAEYKKNYFDFSYTKP